MLLTPRISAEACGAVFKLKKDPQSFLTTLLNVHCQKSLQTKVMFSTSSERMESVSFIEDFVSPYLKGLKFTFTQGNRKRSFDLVLRHSSVAILLYHTTLEKFIFVRQFRPAVLVGHVLRQPENFGKKLKEIDWAKYDASKGYTLELCAGMIDKELPTIDIMREEIEEECGYSVKHDNIHLIATFCVAAHESGGTQYLYYAEIDESMKVSEGGGNVHEGEVITKVFLTKKEVLASLNSDYCLGSPSMLYALLWWFAHKNGQKETSPMQQNTYKWQPKDVVPMKDFKFEKMLSSKRFTPYRMHFTLGPLSRNWDLALCDDSVSILLFNESMQELVLTQRFRPAALVGQARHRSPPGTALESIDWSSQPSELAYTLELCTGHYKRGSSEEEIEARVREIAARKCGYRLDSIRFIISYIVGISFGGDRQRVYYAKVNNSMKISKWDHYEDIVPFSIPCSEITSFLRTGTPTSPPAVLFMLQWFLNNEKK